MGVMRSLSFCYLHYMVTIYIDSCRFFSFFLFSLFFCVWLCGKCSFIYVCVCSLRIGYVHVISVKNGEKKTYIDDFGGFEMKF